MLIKKPGDIKSSEITDKNLYQSRRDFMSASARTLGGIATGIAAPGLLFDSQERHGGYIKRFAKKRIERQRAFDPLPGCHQL